ncbi:protein-glutamate methylesterase/protein-glutamine glutaminase [Sphingomonas abietis]|uniref:Protein-glutamate methylesterase/protein-glutamine glutaminase n=1 Tax=Sphingomonas abietis TaxID=3012344 RepID=A0ABY7NLC4_9SPHN|nr:chemotaxis response regulator protein-glutamate methylesterase [Sphingomonas abietis]WBO20714.1 chemotaxis response regulator protein-glutamate methylesterase [Sphingomonas abietis]
MSVRALIVDDSPAMRAIITHALARDPEIEVVGTADGPASARGLIRELDPDVVTLDIEMPGMNGLDFLDKIMRLRPTPVVMLSTLTQTGAEASIRALELGAFDCMGKPSAAGAMNADYQAALAETVKAAARALPWLRQRQRSAIVEAPSVPVARASLYRPRGDAVIAVGASTGGVEALIALLSTFPEACPPTVIVQHMPESFTTSFAARLDRLSRPRVALATHGAPLVAGQIYLAPGGARHLEISGDGPWRCRLVAGDKVSGHRPSVDRLFGSVAKAVGGSAVAALLTGMGGDGALGLKAMRDAGALTVAQNEETCVVYGMPAAAKALGAVGLELPLDRIARRLLVECRA